MLSCRRIVSRSLILLLLPLQNSRLKKSLEVLEIQFKKMLERESNVVEYKQGRELSDNFREFFLCGVVCRFSPSTLLLPQN